MLLAVAAFAVLFAIGVVIRQMSERSQTYRKRAEVHGAGEALFRAQGANDEAEYHAAMRRKYEHAARIPWASLPADPPFSSGQNHPPAGPAPHPPGRRTADVGPDARFKITIEVAPRPNNQPIKDGDPIECRGTVVWDGVEAPREVAVVLKPGLSPADDFPICDEGSVRLTGPNASADPRSGRTEWKVRLRANKVQGIVDYVITASPTAAQNARYGRDGASVMAYCRVQIR
jgi:hypothetical protein